MKKIECIIMDWAGTAVDYGCFAPVAAFIKAFAGKGLTIDVEQTRKPMGLPKIQHIRELLTMPEVNEQFINRYRGCRRTEPPVREISFCFTERVYRSYSGCDPYVGEVACRRTENRFYYRLYPRDDGCGTARGTGQRIPGGLLCHSESAARRSSCSLYDF